MADLPAHHAEHSPGVRCLGCELSALVNDFAGLGVDEAVLIGKLAQAIALLLAQCAETAPHDAGLVIDESLAEIMTLLRQEIAEARLGWALARQRAAAGAAH